MENNVSEQLRLGDVQKINVPMQISKFKAKQVLARACYCMVVTMNN